MSLLIFLSGKPGGIVEFDLVADCFLYYTFFTTIGSVLVLVTGSAGFLVDYALAAEALLTTAGAIGALFFAGGGSSTGAVAFSMYNLFRLS